MSGDFEIALAKEALGRARIDDFRNAAVAALEAGLDGPALRRLAGASGNSMLDIEYDLRLVKRDLQLQEYSRRDAVLRLATEVARAILDGSVGPREGAMEVCALHYEAPEETMEYLGPFVYADSEWDERPEEAALFVTMIRDAAAMLQRRSRMPTVLGTDAAPD